MFRFGEFRLSTSRFELRRGEDVVKLQRIPLELLVCLVEHHGDLATRGDIVERLWGKTVFMDSEHGINTRDPQAQDRARG